MADARGWHVGFGRSVQICFSETSEASEHIGSHASLKASGNQSIGLSRFRHVCRGDGCICWKPTEAVAANTRELRFALASEAVSAPPPPSDPGGGFLLSETQAERQSGHGRDRSPREPVRRGGRD